MPSGRIPRALWAAPGGAGNCSSCYGPQPRSKSNCKLTTLYWMTLICSVWPCSLASSPNFKVKALLVWNYGWGHSGQHPAEKSTQRLQCLIWMEPSSLRSFRQHHWNSDILFRWTDIKSWRGLTLGLTVRDSSAAHGFRQRAYARPVWDGKEIRDILVLSVDLVSKSGQCQSVFANNSNHTE